MEEKEERLIEILESKSISITFKDHTPYLCVGTNEDYGVRQKISIGDECVTGFNGNPKNTSMVNKHISPEKMSKIKQSIIEILTSETEMNNYTKNHIKIHQIDTTGLINETIEFKDLFKKYLTSRCIIENKNKKYYLTDDDIIEISEEDFLKITNL
jgi:hypothetical protein